jgi:septal ring factor EnvC (AmiA/AmiB activator)
MKCITILIIAVFMVSVSVPVFAIEMTKEQKDQCLLASKGCLSEVDSIQQKMKKLNTEIKKGHRVYSADEINQLKSKLKEAEDMLDALNKQ